MTSLVLLPRIVRYKDAPGYVGVTADDFETYWRPRLTEIPMGPRSLAFDRHDLDDLGEELDASKVAVRQQKPSGLPTQLYRHFNADGRLLYVGISLNAIGRLAEHMHGSGWAAQISRVEIATFPSRYEALRAERLAIVKESPLYNVVYARKRR